MKKKKAIIAVIVILLLVFFVPIPMGVYDDGGTRDYFALTYRIVVWNRDLIEVRPDGSATNVTIYHKARVYWFADSRKKIDELWEREMELIREDQ